MSPLLERRGRLALALLLVVAGVLAIVYLIVVPVLPHLAREHRAEGAPILVAEGRAAELPAGAVPAAAVRRGVSQATNARAVVFSLTSDAPALVEAFADSATERDSTELQNDPVALRAIRQPDAGARHRPPQRPDLRRGRLPGRRFGDHALGLAARPAAGRRARPAARLRRRRARDGVRGALRLRRRQPDHAPDPAARDGRRADRGRDLRPAGGRPRLGRGRAAGADVRAHAAAPREPRPRPRRVHRERLARAAHAALLARRVPGAARRPGPRRADAGGVPGPDARAGRPADEARDRPARPVPARRRGG